VTKIEDIIANMVVHISNCGGQILSSDNPIKKTIGWTCNNCGAQWGFSLLVFKKERELLPVMLRGMLSTNDGRIRLTQWATIVGNGCLWVWEEEAA